VLYLGLHGLYLANKPLIFLYISKNMRGLFAKYNPTRLIQSHSASQSHSNKEATLQLPRAGLTYCGALSTCQSRCPPPPHPPPPISTRYTTFLTNRRKQSTIKYVTSIIGPDEIPNRPHHVCSPPLTGLVYNRAFEQSGSTHFGASKLKFAF